ncbi:Phosphoglycerate mutase [Alkalihalophilus pseudofirmus OF4]|uniref:Phosphoglycerate mutase n=1 Tax=Alkalihalophilus pseudofirmus (strain ATCC BAA-2126 / JCM 17055 / OF4) TaxID=398511 RepID=D3FPZ7_ALKPO|nr:histidine phosphatase family protein [Alkalihalophilus pseudofirmus]ADC51290.1 Phosphoglycerate mutase [Alkalihalophilus pseudofirmus OF4]
MTTIYFVRHAHSTYSTDELGRPLSKQGMEDAKKVTNVLKGEKIDIVLSSPYKRAIQTINGIAEFTGQSIGMVDNFRERVLTTTPAEDFSHAIQRVWGDEAFSWPGGESNLDAQKRGISSLNEILDTYEGKHIVIGTHGNIMVLMMNYFDTSYDFSFWKTLDMPDIFKLTFCKKELKTVDRIWEPAIKKERER